MRKEIENWWKQSLEDFDTAKINFSAKKYYASAFFCQQSAEKALKTLILTKSKERYVEGHSLIYLSKIAKIPNEFIPEMKKLSPTYILSRYPNAS